MTRSILWRFSPFFVLTLSLTLTSALGPTASCQDDGPQAEPKTWPAQARVERVRRDIERTLGGRFSKADFDRAIRPLEALIDGKAKENPLAWAFRGFLYMRVTRDAKRAAADFTKALALDPTHPEASAWSAQLLMATGKTADAKGRLEKAADAHPKSIVVQAALLDLLLRQRKWKDVETRGEALLKLALALPAGKQRSDAITHAAARAGQAEVQQKKLEEAVPHYAQAVRATPKNADLLFAYADVLEKNGRALAATRQLNKITPLIPKGARYDAARQRVAGKIALLKPAADKERRSLAASYRKKTENRVTAAIVAKVKSGADIKDFDDRGPRGSFASLSLNVGRGKLTPKLPVLSKMTAAQRKALYAAIDAHAKTLAPRPTAAPLERFVANPADADTRRRLVELVKNAPGKTFNDKADAVGPKRVWRRVPAPRSKEHLSAAECARRDRAVEMLDAVRKDLTPRRKAWGPGAKGGRLNYAPGTWAWMRDARAILAKTEPIIEHYPLPAAHQIRVLAHWRLGNTTAALDEAILAGLMQRRAVAHRYMSGLSTVGKINWAWNDWLTRGFGARNNKAWKTPGAKQDETARAVFAAIAKNRWAEARTHLTPLASSGFAFGAQSPALHAAAALAIDLDYGHGMLKTALAPLHQRVRDKASKTDIERAISAAERFAATGSTEVALLRAALAKREGDETETVKQLKLALKASPENPNALRMRGEQLERQKDRRGAMLHYNAAVSCRPTPRVPAALKSIAAARDRLERSFGKSLRKQYIEGFNALSRSVERETYGVQLASINRLDQLRLNKLECCRLRVVVLRRLGRDRDALVEGRRYVKMKGADQALGHEQLGAILRNLNEDAPAEAAYTKAIKSGSQNPKAWHYRGGLRFRLKKFDAALRDFDEALRRGVTLPWTHRYRGRILAERGDWKAAEKAFNEAIRLATEQKDTPMVRGTRAERDKRRREAKNANKK